MKFRSKSLSRHPKSGFALIATISIMILLALLAVGLLSLSTVATRSSNQAAGIQEARTNARFALMLAIGQLQTLSGTDRAITASAGTGLLEDGELELGSHNPKAAIRNYVGVWEAAPNPRNEDGEFEFQDRDYPTDGRFNDDSLFKGWLVSNAKPDRLEQQDFFDGASSAESIGFDEVKVKGEVAVNSEKPVFLVHDGSVEEESDYVKAGTVPIVDSTGGDTRVKGRYAYWVGDNNQKALLNTRDLKLRDSGGNGGDHLAKMATPGPYGMESFSGLSEDDGGFTIEANTSESDRIITVKELQLVDDVGLAVPKKNFHDLTTVADSVLANVTSGGLRKDLSLFFEGNPESGNWSGYRLSDNAPVGPYGQEALSNHDQYDTAPWSMLRQFTRVHVGSPVIYDRGGSGNGVVAPDALESGDFKDDYYPGWNTQRIPINPVILRASMILAVGATDINDLSKDNFRIPIADGHFPPKYNGLQPVLDTQIKEDNPAYPRFSKNNYLLNFSAYPVITIWNPYNVPMEVPGFSAIINGTGTEQIVSVDNAPRRVAFHWGVSNEVNGVSASRSAGRGIYHDGDFTLEPGELRTFSVDVRKQPNTSRSLFFPAKELKSPADLAALGNTPPPWNGGFLLNSPEHLKNADHDHRDFYVDDQKTVNDENSLRFSLMGSTTGIFADSSSMISIESREFRPEGINGVDTKPDNPSQPDTMGHQGLVNYEVFSSFNVEMFVADKPSKSTLWKRWDRQAKSSKYSSIVNWRSDKGSPVTISNDMGSGDTQVPPFPMSRLLADRRPFMSIDLRLKSPEISGDLNRTANANCTWLHNIPQFSYTGITDHGSKRSMGGNVSNSELSTAVAAHPYTMRYFRTDDWSDFFTRVHPMERFSGNMIPYVGRSYSILGGSGSVGQRRLVAAEIPQVPLQSIAQFSNLPMVPIDASRWSNHGLQNLAVGNSYASPLLSADSVIFPDRHPSPSNSTSWQGWKVWLSLEQNNTSPPWGGLKDLDGFPWVPKHATENVKDQFPPMRFVDRSYISNTLLWDDFYFSGMASYEGRFYRRLGGQANDSSDMISQFVTDGQQLPNATFRFEDRGVERTDIVSELEGNDGYRKAASYMKVAGGFNVNSLSVKAWKAFLSSNLRKRIPVTSERGSAKRLDDFDTSEEDHYVISRFSSPIELSGNPEAEWAEYNYVSDDDLNDLAERIVTEVAARGPFRSIAEFVNRRVENDRGNPDFAVKGALQAALDKSTVNEELTDRTRMMSESDIGGADYEFPEAALQSRYAGTPEYVMQSDILQSIGPAIQARSDSFIIRAYGESSDGQAKAWCEAQVSRSIDFVNSDENDPEQEFKDLSPVNTAFGRKFRVVSFRWLDRSEV